MRRFASVYFAAWRWEDGMLGTLLWDLGDIDGVGAIGIMMAQGDSRFMYINSCTVRLTTCIY